MKDLVVCAYKPRVKIDHYRNKYKFDPDLLEEEAGFMMIEALHADDSEKLVAIDQKDVIWAACSYYMMKKICILEFMGSSLKGCGILLLKEVIQQAQKARAHSIRVSSTIKGDNLYLGHGFKSQGTYYELLLEEL